MPLPDLDALERDLADLGPPPLVDVAGAVNRVLRAAPDLIAHVRALREALHEACDVIADRAQGYDLGPTRADLYQIVDRWRTLAGPRKETP